MEKLDLIIVDITMQMLEEAEKEENDRAIKHGRSTRWTTRSNGEVVRQDLVGSIAHQAVEIAFERLNLQFTSTRTVAYKGGDAFDIVYEEDFIDVKGTARKFNEKYFYNESFLVYQKQLDDPKIEKITHFCFVSVDFEGAKAYVFGVISLSEFMRKSTERQLQYMNREIKAYQLKPFRKYAFRTS